MRSCKCIFNLVLIHRSFFYLLNNEACLLKQKQPVIFERHIVVYVGHICKDLSCRFCQSGEEETQEHLEVCVGCDFERRGLKMSVRSDIVKFWIRMEKKMVEKKLQEKKEGEKKLQEKKEEEKNRDTVATVT